MGGYVSRKMSENFRQPDNGMFGVIMKRVLIKRNRILELEAVRHSDIQPQHKVLELGFGPGLGIQAAYQLIKDGEGSLCGVDFSSKMVNEASKLLCNEIASGKVQLTLGSVDNMPQYNSNKFDRVFHCNCFYFWPDMKQATEEIYRVMAPNSLIVCTMNIDGMNELKGKNYMQFGFYDPDRYINAMEDAGFKGVRLEHMRRDKFKYQIIYARVGSK